MEFGAFPGISKCYSRLKNPRVPAHMSGVLFGLCLVKEYMRREYIRGRLPKQLRVSNIIRELGLSDTNAIRTRIGWALGDLTRFGLLDKRNGGGSKHRYVLNEEFIRHLQKYGCLTRCDSSCPLFGSLKCPFLEGVARSA
ncbi:MAG: hypothetical protein F7B19_06655 [Desulfurococcales archaeon]|nr:hypothetical protein [Desulfurococcales archaeon]